VAESSPSSETHALVRGEIYARAVRICLLHTKGRPRATPRAPANRRRRPPNRAVVDGYMRGGKAKAGRGEGESLKPGRPGRPPYSSGWPRSGRWAGSRESPFTPVLDCTAVCLFEREMRTFPWSSLALLGRLLQSLACRYGGARQLFAAP